MAIRNNLLGGNDIQENEVEFKSVDYNDTNNAMIGVTTEAFKAQLQNSIRQAIDRSSVFSADGDDVFVEAYVNSTGRNNTVDTSETTAVFDTNKYEMTEEPINNFVVIEATSLVESDFIINGCLISEIDSGKWAVFSNIGNDEEQRARIYATLFFGPSTNRDSTNQGRVFTSITGLTAIKTTFTRDIGKKVTFMRGRVTANVSNRFMNVDLEFDSTTGNDDVSFWSRVEGTVDSGSGTMHQRFIVNGSTINSNTGSGLSNHINTDRTVNETNNPSTVRVEMAAHSGPSGNNRSYLAAFILTEEFLTITNVSESSEQTSFSLVNMDSIPNITEATETVNVPSGVIVHNLPSVFQKPMTTSVGSVLFEDFETGSKVRFKFQDDVAGDTGWLEAGEISSFPEITPTKLIVKLIPRTTSPTHNYPSIRGFALYGDKQ